MTGGDELPDPRPPLRHPALMDLSFAALGWMFRLVEAVGSPRFGETLERTQFYLTRANGHASTPAERAVVRALFDGLGEVNRANLAAERLLAESVSGMGAADATEFVELCEADQDPGLR